MTRAVLQAGRLALAAGLAAHLVAASAAVQAQPIRLIPPGGNPDEAPAPAQAPAQSQPPAQSQAPALPAQSNTPPLDTPAGLPGNAQADQQNRLQTVQQETDGFVIQPLGAPDPSSTGLLDDTNGGLGAHMWDGTALRQAIQVLGVLPAPVATPALRDLQRRLLLTIAEVPKGEPGTPSLLGTRISQLYKLGLVGEAEQLATPRPASLKDPIFLQLPVEAALLRNDLDRACEMANQGLREDGAAYWQKIVVLCRYHAKDIAGGDLALSLWRDNGGDDPPFNALAAALRGDARAKVETLGGASAVHFAMLRAAGRPLPKDTLDVATPALLPALARYEKADAELRLAAIERAARYGALPPAALAEAYAAVEIADNQRAALAGGKDKSARAAAYLYQSVKAATDAKTRAEFLRQAFELAQARELLFPTAAILQPFLADVTPDDSTIAAAPAMIRLALAARDTGIARLWYNTALTIPPETGKAGETVAQAWPLLLLAGAEAEWRDSRYEAWLATLDSLKAPERNMRITLLLTLAEGVGFPVPPERWDILLVPVENNARPAPSIAVWRSLLRASEIKARAETAALALALLGPNGAEEADGLTLTTALEALRKVELEVDARRIALDVALRRGL
jgi:hypothetical protein